MRRITPVGMLAQVPRLDALAADQALAVAGLRLWAVMARMGGCPIKAAEERLGNARAAAHFHLLMEEIAAAWPEPFCVSPPCSPRLSHDEATLAEMVACAARGDRPGFDRLLGDLLPADERERLYLSAHMLARALP